MKNKWMHLLVACIFFVTMTFFLLAILENDVLKQKKIDKVLFNSLNFTTQRTCYKNLISLSIHGEVFDFYRYQIKGEVNIINSESYPKFDSIFLSQKLKNKVVSHWKPTPIIENDDPDHICRIADYANLSQNECSMEFQKTKYLNREGCYYSYVSAYPIGIYLFIYDPSDSQLFVIVKKG